MQKRPNLDTSISIDDFQNYYWLKKELVDFCKKEELSQQGGKIEIAERITSYLKTGQKQSIKKQFKSNSKFDWKNEILHLSTIITDNYKNTENVRRFFNEHVNKKFKFNVKFMAWMKNNVGKSLADAIEVWEKIENEKKKIVHKEIAPQFEYNRYIRDFLKDNPSKTKSDAIQYWKLKRDEKGNNVYKKSDLKLK